MSKGKLILNAAAVAMFVASAPVAFAPSSADAAVAASGGTCCEDPKGTCYLNLDGVIIRDNGYSSDGPCAAT